MDNILLFSEQSALLKIQYQAAIKISYRKNIYVKCVITKPTKISTSRCLRTFIDEKGNCVNEKSIYIEYSGNAAVVRSVCFQICLITYEMSAFGQYK